ncbi:hypothetical protein, partial [Salmonella enterica]|uniref:hypothetical protein n=1 Tax=Salmonella enterica TaxID=28901 RepID=UPI0020C512FB
LGRGNHPGSQSRYGYTGFFDFLFMGRNLNFSCIVIFFKFLIFYGLLLSIGFKDFSQYWFIIVNFMFHQNFYLYYV